MGLLLVPVAAFIALVAGLVVVLRRAGRILAGTRRLDAFRTSLRDLTQRIDGSLDGTLDRVDALRRQQVGADTVLATIETSADAVARYADEARALDGPGEGLAIRDDLVEDLERVGRALAMVRQAPPSSRAGSAASPGPKPRLRSSEATWTCSMLASRSTVAPPRPKRCVRRRRTHHVVVSSAHTTSGSGADGQESDALPPVWRAGHPRRRLTRPG